SSNQLVDDDPAAPSGARHLARADLPSVLDLARRTLRAGRLNATRYSFFLRVLVKIYATPIETPYSKIKGTAIKNWLSKSGGVSTAASTNAKTTKYRKNLMRWVWLMRPATVRKNATTGSSNTPPNTSNIWVMNDT